MTEWITDEDAAALTGKSIAEIDAAAASGAVDAQYSGWQLLVPKPEEVVHAVAKKALAKKATKSTSTSKN